jgi:hypothetical protein
MPSYRLKLVGHAFVRRGSQQHRPSAFEVVHSFGYPADLLGQIVEAPNARLKLCTFRDHSGRYPTLRLTMQAQRRPTTYVPYEP